jgi:hypothetical protein
MHTARVGQHSKEGLNTKTFITFPTHRSVVWAWELSWKRGGSSDFQTPFQTIEMVSQMWGAWVVDCELCPFLQIFSMSGHDEK